MKKLIVLGVFVSFATFVFADACYDTYLSALKAYKNGDYAEAQRKFILVAQSCGNYQEVYQKLKDCNTKIKEKQAASANEISTLKANNKSQTEQYNKLKEKQDSLLRISAQNKVKLDETQSKLKKRSEELEAANNRCAELCKDTTLLRQNLDAMQKQNAMLTDSLTTLHKNYTIKPKDKDKKDKKNKASDAAVESDNADIKSNKENK